MADKKKTVTKKVTTATKKAATTAKKTTKKVTSTAKKATSTAKKTTKKATKKVTKKATPRVMDSVKSNSILSFADWRSIVASAFENFKVLWWRMAVIVLLSIVSMIAAMAVTALVIFAVGGGLSGLENELANLTSGTLSLGFLWVLAGAVIFFVTAVIALSSVSRLAFLLTFKNHKEGKPNSPMTVFFKQAWPFVWRYLWLMLRITWFMLWPMALIMIVASVLSWQLGSMVAMSELGQIWFWIAVSTIAIGVVIWRLIQIAFVDFVLIEGNKSAKEAFEKARSLVQGNWWKVFFPVFSFFFVITAIQLILETNGIQQDSEGNVVSATGTEIAMTITSNLLSVFVFAPFAICYLYLLMLHLSKAKKIKL